MFEFDAVQFRWSDNMHNLRDGGGVLADVYTVFLVVFGAYGVVTLMLAVLQSKSLS